MALVARDPAELLGDDGVVPPGPVIEFGGWQAVRARGGIAIVAWRADFLAAVAAGIDARPDADSLATASHSRVVVHLQKGRAGWRADCAAAARLLRPDGELLLVGGNELGIASAAKQLGREWQVPVELRANRARARVLACPPPLQPPAVATVDAVVVDDLCLQSAPGIFAAGRLDQGSALLLEHLDQLPSAAVVADLGAGIGVLGLAALRRWPAARLWAGEADHRALRCLQANAAAVGIERVAAHWWDASEAWPGPAADTILLNPPCHTGKATDLRVPRLMFRRVAECLAPGGRCLVVANRQLPYEADLAAIGRLRQLAQVAGFKLLVVER